MNLTKLKNYAPQARQAFVQAMTDRAAFYGVTAAKIEPIVEKGDVAFIGGREYPRAVVSKRKALEDLVAKQGFAQTIETLAYTWFNRLVAIRYMELHGYLDHGYRVLSHPEGKPTPEILEHAEHVDLPGLDKQTVIDLKLDGSKDAQLYRLLLVAQCNALNEALPFLFARIDDETELVLPDNLLHSESLISNLVSEISDEDCAGVEILGWLYQFYISERKGQVMARKSAVPTEDIPAVTQLFTPHWIVRYLVENSLGRLWLLNRPGSRLREHMPYFIEGQSETDFLKISKPEEIRLLDPAVGSGHMLTYAFDLLYLVYEEEGYAPAEIPALILRHNLHGLEICPRAAQLAELALIFKAREKSRRFFRPGNLVQPRILALQDIRFTSGELESYFTALGINPSTVVPQPASSFTLFHQFEEATTSQSATVLTLLHQFEEATTVGSLIHPCLDAPQIAATRRAIEAKDLTGQLFLHETHGKVLCVLRQAEMLCQEYHVIVANPPYLGSKGMNARQKLFLEKHFPEGKSDLFAAFILRNLLFAHSSGLIGMVTPYVWMFLSSYNSVRKTLLENATIHSLVQLEYNAFEPACVPVCAYTLVKKGALGMKGSYIKLSNFRGHQNQAPRTLEAIANPECGWFYRVSAKEFTNIPGSPIAYALPHVLIDLFKRTNLSSIGHACSGIQTGDNDLYLRYWHEISTNTLAINTQSFLAAKASSKRWLPHKKGGELRKWYGNDEYVIDWSNDGASIKSNPSARPQNLERMFDVGVTWSHTTSSGFGARIKESATTFNVEAPCLLLEQAAFMLAYLNSALVARFLDVLAPTLHYLVGTIKLLPAPIEAACNDHVAANSETLIAISRADWDNFETSWNFRDLPLLRAGTKGATLAESWKMWRDQCDAAVRRMQELETENNRLFIDAYGLTDELKPEVPEEQITLARADVRRDIAAIVSYAVGCMMGRFSLDHLGLILANAGDTRAEYLAKVGCTLDALTFIPDEDGIIPVLDGEWFEDDIVARARDFLRATFGEARREENLRFIEESLGKDLRKYFLSEFYKDHLQTYKRRPIYWLFSSGKQRAFQCLVYLHRYNEATLSRMRTEYVIPLQSRITARIELLKDDVSKATSTSHRKKLQKEQDDLKKQQTELLAFDEKLKHTADQKIKLDLDDGVKVNYGKFGDLLAEVKAVTGGADE